MRFVVVVVVGVVRLVYDPVHLFDGFLHAVRLFVA
jgi:hypothetical protein